MTRISPWLVHKHLVYDLEMMVRDLPVTKRTCYRWINQEGLKRVSGCKRPILVRGQDLQIFLKAKNSKHEVSLKSNEFYCFGCKAPRRAKEGSINVIGKIKKALCGVCERKVNVTIKLSQRDYSNPSPPVQMSFKDVGLNY